MTRLDFSFPGTVDVDQGVSLDPAEFKGLQPPQITAEILKTLRSINKDASFFPEAITAAAEVIYEANVNPYVPPTE